MGRYILALDQGTTSSRAMLFDGEARAVAVAQREFPQIFPQPGWVEHDPLAIWESQLHTARTVLAEAGITAADLAGLGLANQRETTVVWERATGRPVHNALVWQCRRTAPLCEELKREGWGERIAAKTGLVLDAYFSGTKLAWILGHVPGARQRAERGELLFGTIDTWLVWHLSGGRLHLTDYSNASRTMLYNLHVLDWDDEILERLRIPRCILPVVKPSSCLYGETAPEILGAPVPIAGMAGDQQAALFGQACFTPGSAKVTYGTGCFLLLNTGSTPAISANGLLTTIAWGLPSPEGPRITYALEGGVFTGGAVIQWLRDELGILGSAAESEELARSVEYTGGVYLVPALTGLGAPYWDMYARGALLGLTRGSGRGHLARAALEAIAYQVRDVLEAMTIDARMDLGALRADGGASANRFLLQFQADILDTVLETPAIIESTALGAAFLAGLATGVFPDLRGIADLRKAAAVYKPGMARGRREALYGGWRNAVAAARQFRGLCV